MRDLKTRLGKLAYGILFCVVLPFLLWQWALRLDSVVSGLPSPEALAPGLIAALAGLQVMVAGVIALWRKGGGVPMNISPPPKLVTGGIYAWLGHPIYIGFVLLLAGVFAITGSAGGFWLVTPAVALACAALVFGYEAHDLRRRFPDSHWETIFGLPPQGESSPSRSQRFGAAAVAFVPRIVTWSIVVALVPTADAHSILFTFGAGRHSAGWHSNEWFATIDLFGLLFTGLAPFAAGSRSALRTFVAKGWLASAVGLYCALVFSSTVVPQQFEPNGALASWLELDRMIRAASSPTMLFPWMCLAAHVYASRWPRWRAAGVAGVVAMAAASTVTHSLLDLILGIMAALFVMRSEQLWQWALAWAEHVGNSWSEWRLGPLRIINHGLYAALAGFVGILLASSLLPSDEFGAVVIVACFAAVGAGLWGQLIEGGFTLKRPFGYYGSLLGGAVGIVVAELMWHDGWWLAAAAGVVAPLVQALGRLRCLVQGCCHGRPATRASAGIRYFNSISRVVFVAHLRGVPVYPTPLYSLCGNLVIFGLLLKLWLLAVPASFIAGTYLFLSGCARFIEESYRGEPQTPRVLGLPIYQWIAVASALTGAALTACQSPPVIGMFSFPTLPWIGVSCFVALLWGILLGVDFPESSKRFSRLT